MAKKKNSLKRDHPSHPSAFAVDAGITPNAVVESKSHAETAEPLPKKELDGRWGKEGVGPTSTVEFGFQ